VARDIQILFDVGAAGGLSDGQLLERFVAGRDEAVFEVIVRRHGPMVWGVCRRVLRDHHDAEDAFQATFVVLARRATAVTLRDKLGPWLHGVATRTAAKVRATKARRRWRESQAPGPAEAEPTPDNDRDDWLPLLDREVQRLPEKYRIPIVLCELEGKTHREAADQLGWPIGTVSGRLSRARALLARRLTRPEWTDSGLPLVVLSTGRIVPTRLMTLAVKLASPNAVGLVSAEVVLLTERVVRTMWLSKIKLTAAVLLGGLLAVGATGLTYRAMAADGSNPPPVLPASPPAAAPQNEASPAPASPAPVPEPPADPMASYPFMIDATEVYEFPSLQVAYRDFKLKADGPVQVLPMKTERGVAGAVLLGLGDFEFTPEPGKTITGHQRAVMLRFNPDEHAAILPLAKGKKVTDQGAAELSRHLCRVVVNHCWQRGGKELIILPKGAMAAVLYSREHGDLLISFGDKDKVAYNFTTKVPLYEKK